MRLNHILLLAVLLLSGQAAAGINIRSNLAADYVVQTGESFEGRILIENTGGEDATVRVYQTDYSFEADGSNTFGEAGSMERSNAEWVTVESSLLTLPANSRMELEYQVTVPDDDLIGSYWSVIMLEETTRPPSETEGVAVVTVVRYAVQVVTTIGASGNSSLDFIAPNLMGGRDAGHSFTVDVSNDGERMLQADYYLDVYDDTGTHLQRVEGPSRRTYPGSSIRLNFPLGSLPPASYRVIVVADGGGEDLFGAQYRLDVNE